MATRTLDSYVARFVRRELADRQQSAQVVAELLGIGIDTARRKLRGAQTFSLDEVAILSREFGVSLYSLAEDAREREEGVLA